MLNLSKIFYVLVRTLSLFGLPGLRALRSKIYAWHFKAPGMNVSDRVMVVAAHASGAATIKFGEGSELGSDAYIDYSGGISFGDRLTISEGAKLFTHNHPVRRGDVNWRSNPIQFTHLEVGDDVWIGASAIILPRVRRIGRGAVIGAGAVVAHDVRAYEVVAGNPAALIYVRDSGSDDVQCKTGSQGS